MAQGKEKRKIL